LAARAWAARLAGALAILLYLPWLPEVHGSFLAEYGLLEPLNFTNVSADVVRLVPGYSYAPLQQIPGIPLLTLVGACLLLGAIVRRGSQEKPTPAPRTRGPVNRLPGGPAFLALLAATTPIGLLLYSLLRPDIWDARNLYASPPAVALLFGWLLTAAPQRTRLLPAIAVIAILVFGTIKAISPRYRRPPFRTVAHLLDRVAPSRDPVVLVAFYLDLDYDMGVEFRRPHRVFYGLPEHVPLPPHGGSAWVVIEAASPTNPGRAPHFPGLRLIAARHYLNSLIPFSLLRYVDADSAGGARGSHRRLVRAG
jgi:hypothetical protein